MPNFPSAIRASPLGHAGPVLDIHQGDDGAAAARLTVIGEIDLATAPSFHTAVRSAIALASGPVSIDMRRVTFCDAAGLRALTDAAALVRTLEGRLTVIGPCRALELLLELVEPDITIDVVPAEDCEPDDGAPDRGPDMVRDERDPQSTSPTIPTVGHALDGTRHDGAPADTRRPEPALMAELPAGHAVLMTVRGPNVRDHLILDTDRTLVGRHAEADIRLDHVTVSRRHAEFLSREGGHVLRDLGSLNGTYVNGQRIDAAVLHTGDEVQIGKYRFTYHRGSPNG